jgi:predicted ArsR family transcriptional regulator
MESTRGRIVALLRGHPSTVEELTSSLGLTNNAVRAQLAALERDSLVEHAVVRRRGAGKPAYAYSLTTEAEMLLSAAYGPALAGLLDALSQGKRRRGEREALMRAAGRHMAGGTRVALGSVRRRLGSAVDFLNELGAVAKLERSNGSAVISSRSCPLAAVVQEHPQACEALAGAVETLLGAPTTVQCVRNHDLPQCEFEITLPSRTAR